MQTACAKVLWQEGRAPTLRTANLTSADQSWGQREVVTADPVGLWRLIETWPSPSHLGLEVEKSPGTKNPGFPWEVTVMVWVGVRHPACPGSHPGAPSALARAQSSLQLHPGSEALTAAAGLHRDPGCSDSRWEEGDSAAWTGDS